MKKISLVIFAFLLVITIPLTISFLQRKQETKSHASASTNLYFLPSSSATSPIGKNTGNTFSLDLMVDPGNNIVTFIRFQVQFDTNFLAPADSNAFVLNTASVPTMVEGPLIDPAGAITGSVSVGSDPTKAITKPTKVGTFTFKALAPTQGTPTIVRFGSLSQALSSGPNDQSGENVLATALPATIAITDSGSVTPSPSSIITPSPGVSDIPTPLPTGIATTLSFTILLDGIGNRGDNPNPNGSSLSNKNPLHPQRNLDVLLYNSSNQQVAHATTAIVYDTGSGAFTGQLDLGPSFPAGNYNIKLKSEPYLRKLVPGILAIRTLQDNPVPQTSLVAGDINGDNLLNILDYNALLGCGYGEINPLPMDDPHAVFNTIACQNLHIAQTVDIDDNGIINSSDYNLFLRELSVQNGD